MWLDSVSSRLPFLKQGRYFGISQSTSLNFSLIFLANVVNNGTNFIANIIIARMFGHEVFGLFSIAVNIALTTLTLSEFGMNLTMVRLYKLHDDNPARAKAIILWNYYFKWSMLLLLTVIAILLSRTLSDALMKRHDKALLVAMALIGGGVLGLWSYLKAFFQSKNLFNKIASLTFFYAFLRLIFLAVFVGFSLNPVTELIFSGVYLIPVFLTLLLGFYLINGTLNSAYIVKKDLFEAGKEIISYSKWVAISAIAYSLFQRVIIFMAATYTDMTQVALVSAGFVFTGIISLINDSARQVLFPKIAQLKLTDLLDYKKRIYKITPLYFIISIMLIGILSIVMIYTLGSKYQESLPIFWISGMGMLITTGIGFYTISIHTLQKPHIEAYINVGRLLILLIVLFLLKTYGIMSMVWAYSIIIVLGEIIMSFYISYYVKRYSA